MNLSVHIRHLLVVLLMLGVGATPFAAKAAAVGFAIPVAMAAMEPMADGMPCCPDDAPVMPDCQKSCPLLATCMTTCAPAAPDAFAVHAGRMVAFAANPPGDDASRPSPDTGPPARPPRS